MKDNFGEPKPDTRTDLQKKKDFLADLVGKKKVFDWDIKMGNRKNCFYDSTVKAIESTQKEIDELKLKEKPKKVKKEKEVTVEGITYEIKEVVE